jgi:hypothetical protein
MYMEFLLKWYGGAVWGILQILVLGGRNYLISILFDNQL